MADDAPAQDEHPSESAGEGPGADETGGERRSHRARVAGMVVLVLAALAALASLVDAFRFELFGSAHLKGMDYFFVVFHGVFLSLLILLRRKRVQLSVAFLTIVVLVLLLELGLTAARPSTGRDWPWYVWPPNFRVLTDPPDLHGVTPPGEFTTNSRGIRGPEFSDEDRFRILCVGGSTAECMYLDDSEAWPHLLGERLKDISPHIWVGNLGRSGLAAKDHAVLLEHVPEASMADCWLVLVGGNDLGLRCRGRYEEQTSHSFSRTFVYRRPGLSGQLRSPFHRNLFLYRALQNVYLRIKVVLRTGEADAIVYQDMEGDWVQRRQALREEGDAKLDWDRMPHWLTVYEAELMRMVRLARTEGKTLVFATQPALWAEDMPAEHKDLCLGSQNPSGEWYSLADLGRGMAAFNERTREVSAREGVLCVDLARLLPKSPDVFYDDLHFNEEGARRVARCLAEAVRPVVRERIEGKN